MASEDNEPGGDYSVHKVMAEVQAEFLRYLVNKLGNRDEAADVLQNFYVRVLDRIEDVRDTEKLRGWMRKVLHTTLIDHYRTQSKRRGIEKEYDLHLSVSAAPNPKIRLCRYSLASRHRRRSPRECIRVPGHW